MFWCCAASVPLRSVELSLIFLRSGLSRFARKHYCHQPETGHIMAEECRQSSVYCLASFSTFFVFGNLAVRDLFGNDQKVAPWPLVAKCVVCFIKKARVSLKKFREKLSSGLFSNSKNIKQITRKKPGHLNVLQPTPNRQRPNKPSMGKASL